MPVDFEGLSEGDKVEGDFQLGKLYTLRSGSAAVFKGRNDWDRFLNVRYYSPDSVDTSYGIDGQGVEIGSIAKYEADEGHFWKISNLGGSWMSKPNITDDIRAVSFDEFRQAVHFLSSLYLGVQENPTPHNVRDYIARTAEDLTREYRDARSRVQVLEMRLSNLRYLAEEAKLPEIVHHIDGSKEEPSEEVKRFKEFFDENYQAIYEGLGKHFARDLISHVRGVIAITDSELADSL
jgi:hypothetical protein